MNIESIAYREKAYAKINLSLDITGKRSDGYHTVSMLMQTVTLCDDISVKRRDDGEIALYGMDLRPWGSGSCESGNCHLRFGKDDLCVKAGEAMRKAYGIKSGLSIYLEKRIPIAAGLAGGSADAAAVMRAIRTIFHLPATDEDLRRLALGLGADVPYCIAGGTALCEGVGEEITPLPAFGPVPVVLVKPAFSISTPESYKTYDRLAAENPGIFRRPDNAGMISALKDCSYSGFYAGMGNVLRDVASSAHPEIAEIEDELKARGAASAMMSGSGPTVYGIFADEKCAGHAAAAIAERPGIEAAILCRTCSPAQGGYGYQL